MYEWFYEWFMVLASQQDIRTVVGIAFIVAIFVYIALVVATYFRHHRQ